MGFGSQNARSMDGMAMDRAGNAYVTGNATAPFQIGAIAVPTAEHPKGIYLVKFAPRQNPPNRSRYDAVVALFLQGPDGMQARSVATDGLDNVYVTGEFGDSLSVGGLTLVGGNGNNGFLAKFDSKGKPVWLRRFAGGERFETAGTVRVDFAGNPVLLGRNNDKARNLDTLRVGDSTFNWGPSGAPDPGYGYFLAKYDSAGNFLWTRQFKTVESAVSETWRTPALELDAAGDILLAGHFNSLYEVRFDTLRILGGSRGNKLFVAKFSSDGAFRWLRVLATCSGRSNLNSLAIRPSGNLVIAGHYQDSLVFADTMVRAVPPIFQDNQKDLVLAELDSAGKRIWLHASGSGISDDLQNVKLDAQGNAYVGGYSSSIPGFSGYPGSPPRPSYTYGFVGRFDPVGRLQWVREISKWSSNMALAVADTVVITGFQATGTIDTTGFRGLVLRPNNENIYLATLSPNSIALPLRERRHQRISEKRKAVKGAVFHRPPNHWTDASGKRLPGESLRAP